MYELYKYQLISSTCSLFTMINAEKDVMNACFQIIVNHITCILLYFPLNFCYMHELMNLVPSVI